MTTEMTTEMTKTNKRITFSGPVFIVSWNIYDKTNKNIKLDKHSVNRKAIRSTLKMFLEQNKYFNSYNITFYQKDNMHLLITAYFPYHILDLTNLENLTFYNYNFLLYDFKEELTQKIKPLSSFKNVDKEIKKLINFTKETIEIYDNTNEISNTIKNINSKELLDIYFSLTETKYNPDSDLIDLSIFVYDLSNKLSKLQTYPFVLLKMFEQSKNS